MSQAEEKLHQMGLSLPPPPQPVANYVPAVRSGNLVFLAGAAPRLADGSLVTGKLGSDLTVERGYEAARLCGLNLLANLEREIGDLDEVPIVKPHKRPYSRSVLCEPTLETIDERDGVHEGPAGTPIVVEDVHPHRRRELVVPKLLRGKVRHQHWSRDGRDRGREKDQEAGGAQFHDEARRRGSTASNATSERRLPRARKSDPAIAHPDTR